MKAFVKTAERKREEAQQSVLPPQETTPVAVEATDAPATTGEGTDQINTESGLGADPHDEAKAGRKDVVVNGVKEEEKPVEDVPKADSTEVCACSHLEGI